jgi:hypothetical protein
MDNLPVWQLGHPGRLLKFWKNSTPGEYQFNQLPKKIKEPAGNPSITDSITGSKLNNTTGKDQEGAVLGTRADLDHGSSR